MTLKKKGLGGKSKKLQGIRLAEYIARNILAEFVPKYDSMGVSEGLSTKKSRTRGTQSSLLCLVKAKGD